jgi:hypothetical protein
MTYAWFEVFIAVTMKNAVFWDVAPCRSCVNRRFGGTYRLHLHGRKIRERGTILQPPAHAGSSLADFSTLKIDTFLRNVGSHKIYTAPHPRRRHSSTNDLVSWGGVRLCPLGTSATNWPIVPAPDYRRWWVWSSRRNKNWQGKPKYSEKTCPSATLSTTNPTWPDLGSNLGRRGVKPATSCVIYGTA